MPNMRAFVVLACAFVAFLLGVASAFAHAEPASITPGAGAVLNEAPAQVIIVMSGEMAIRDGANDIDVFDAAGNEITVVAAIIDRSDRRRLTVALPSNLGPGKYTVKWKALSAEDGDPAEGPPADDKITFTVDPAARANPGRTELRPDLLNPGGEETPAAENGQQSPAFSVTENEGVTWVLVIAVGIAMFVVGAGGTFLLVQKRA